MHDPEPGVGQPRAMASRRNSRGSQRLSPRRSWTMTHVAAMNADVRRAGTANADRPGDTPPCPAQHEHDRQRRVLIGERQRRPAAPGRRLIANGRSTPAAAQYGADVEDVAADDVTDADLRLAAQRRDRPRSPARACWCRSANDRDADERARSCPGPWRSCRGARPPASRPRTTASVNPATRASAPCTSQLRDDVGAGAARPASACDCGPFAGEQLREPKTTSSTPSRMAAEPARGGIPSSRIGTADSSPDSRSM